jgi:hypothetical protein
MRRLGRRRWPTRAFRALQALFRADYLGHSGSKCPDLFRTCTSGPLPVPTGDTRPIRCRPPRCLNAYVETIRHCFSQAGCAKNVEKGIGVAMPSHSGSPKLPQFCVILLRLRCFVKAISSDVAGELIHRIQQAVEP